MLTKLCSRKGYTSIAVKQHKNWRAGPWGIRIIPGWEKYKKWAPNLEARYIVASADRQLEPPRGIGFECPVATSSPISVAYVPILCGNGRAEFEPFLESSRSVLNGGS